MKTAKLKMVRLYILWIFVIICVFILGYFITMLIFTILPEVPQIILYVSYGLISIIILTLVWRSLNYIYRRTNREDFREKIFKNTIEAIQRISKGDFKVVLDTDNFAPHNMLINSINEMAKELSTMEMLRQDFVSNVSHEMQSPLTSINGYVTLL